MRQVVICAGALLLAGCEGMPELPAAMALPAAAASAPAAPATPESLLVEVDGRFFSALAAPRPFGGYEVQLATPDRETAIRAYLSFCRGGAPYVPAEWEGERVERNATGVFVITGPCARPAPPPVPVALPPPAGATAGADGLTP
ncbi:hypothetical protein OG2516_02918 [Oceanicola granulosus HTCC2516]|uniref:Lipoprotein n=1 Tax=Oceanicola granulosus (strain ATCC BAA-861 / DSM 15982 / KCTC 12143 / HTCC2516) TaxID=314256 RepID=Q2CA08_OCEGH|nr:hypothetical protein [Oceanicola granulosus]EAR49502.1 hypothetical protein OG2516_02918 [Oceanicola granulosus HTCC2516]